MLDDTNDPRMRLKAALQSYLLEMNKGKESPVPIRLLFDPMFSDRAGPSAWTGIRRRLPPPCSIPDLPEYQFVLISHNQCVPFPLQSQPTACLADIFVPGVQLRPPGLPKHRRDPSCARFKCHFSCPTGVEGMDDCLWGARVPCH